jgi:NitT/TauT family transport system permease protein
VLLLLGVWQLFPALLSQEQTRLFPTPHDLIRLMGDPQPLSGGFADNQNPWLLLLRFSWNTLWRVVLGVGIALLIAYPIGLIVGLLAILNCAIGPVLRWFAALSPVAWLPLGMLVIANDNSLAVFLVIVSIGFSLAIATANSVANVDPQLVETARTLGVSGLSRITRVIIPATLPESFFTIRLNLLAAWMAVLIAEVVGLQQKNWGLGSLVWQGRQSANYAVVVLGMVCLATLGLLADKMFHLVQTRFLWWRNPSGQG